MAAWNIFAREVTISNSEGSVNAYVHTIHALYDEDRSTEKYGDMYAFEGIVNLPTNEVARKDAYAAVERYKTEARKSEGHDECDHYLEYDYDQADFAVLREAFLHELMNCELDLSVPYDRHMLTDQLLAIASKEISRKSES